MTEPSLTWHHPFPLDPSPRNYAGNAASIQILGDQPKRRQAIIQNTSTATVFLNLGAAASNADGGYFYVLSAGTGAADGKGGSIVLSNWPGKIYAYATGSFTVAATEI